MRVEQRGGIIGTGRFTGTQSVINPDKSLILIIFAIFLVDIKHIDESFITRQKWIFLIKGGEFIEQIFEVGEVVIFGIDLEVSVQKCVESIFIMMTAATQIADSQ